MVWASKLSVSALWRGQVQRAWVGVWHSVLQSGHRSEGNAAGFVLCSLVLHGRELLRVCIIKSRCRVVSGGRGMPLWELELVNVVYNS